MSTDASCVAGPIIAEAVINALRAGTLPDMLTSTPDGRALLVASEGDPDGDYETDRPDAVSVIDVSGTIAELDQSSVMNTDFTPWDPGGPAMTTMP